MQASRCFLVARVHSCARFPLRGVVAEDVTFFRVDAHRDKEELSLGVLTSLIDAAGELLLARV